MSDINFIQFISGIGLFLYGMAQIESSVRTLSSQSFKRLLEKYTNSHVGSVVTGAVVTATVQSSSLVGLMVLALVGAGVMPLMNAIGVVVGSNLGTTATGWLVTALGFKLKLSLVAIPLMGGGGLVWLFLSHREKMAALASLVFGLGLLIFGLDTMKTGVEQLATTFDVTWIQGYPLIIYLFVGAGLSMAIQSSSATMMIALSALNAGLFDLPSAAALIIGADLGTTSTMALGSIKGSALKRQVALAQILFNLISDVLAFIFMKWILLLVAQGYGIADPLYSLVAFHTTFNLIGITLFLPFLSYFSSLLEKLFVDESDRETLYVHNVPELETAQAIVALEKEAKALMNRVVHLNVRCLKVNMPRDEFKENNYWYESHLTFAEQYEGIKRLEGEVVRYAALVQAGTVSPLQANLIQQLLNSVRHGVYSAKALKDIRGNLPDVRHRISEMTNWFQQVTELCGSLYGFTFRALKQDHESSFLQEELASYKNKVIELYIKGEKCIYLFYYKQQVESDFSDASTLLNVNRELRASSSNLIKALTLLLIQTDNRQSEP